MATKFLGIKKGYQAMVALMELMQNGTVTQQELSRLSVNIFRFSQARAMSTVEDFLRNRSSWNDVMRSKVKWDCFSAWNEVDYKTTAKAAYAFIRSQGSLFPPVALGRLLDSAPGGWILRNKKYDKLELMVRSSLLRNLLNVNTKVVKSLLTGEGYGRFFDNIGSYYSGCGLHWHKLGEEECKSPETEQRECCRVRAFLGENLGEVMGIMSHRGGPISCSIEEERNVEDYRKGLASLNFPRLEDNSSTVKQAFVPEIYHSAFLGRSDYSHRCKFSKMYSMRGVSFTFNSVPFWQMYMDLPSSRAFYENVHKKSPDCGDLREEPYASIAGPSNSFLLLLAAPASGLDIALHSPFIPADIGRMSLRVHPNHVHTIMVTPYVTNFDKNVQRKMSLEEESGSKALECFSGQNHLAFFKHYSQAGCLLECNVMRAYGKCGCIPWNFPRMNESALLCKSGLGNGMFSAGCFEEAMSRHPDVTECSCPVECNAVHYMTSVDTKVFKIKKVAINLLKLDISRCQTLSGSAKQAGCGAEPA